MTFKKRMMKPASMNWKLKYPPLLFAILILGLNLGVAQDEDDSVEGLYRKAVEFNANGDPVNASKTFEKLFDLAKPDLLLLDYGPQAGGMFFDYAMTLVPQKRWTDAKEWFKRCIDAKAEAKKVESPLDNENPRESLARFQLGFVESQLENHEEALRLYELYLNSKPPQQELAMIRNSFFLRKGTSQIKLGKVTEGIATVQQLFDNREAWKVSPTFLMQGILELGLGWIEQAKNAGADPAKLAAIETQANVFLDQNLAFVSVQPFDSFRFGFLDRFRKLGYEATKAGLYTLGLRFFSSCATLDEVKKDIDLRLARLPVGSGVPSAYQQFIDQIAEREKAPIHPDAETLRLVATCYERSGNLQIPRGIYWHLSETYPKIDLQKRAEILHEAARFSAMMTDYASAQYFGEKFMKELPEDHPLRDNVATFMLQSLFTLKQYETVTKVCEAVRSRYDLGDEKRELADALYPLALYSLKRHEDAIKPFDEYIATYEETGNREMVVFHRGSNNVILEKWRVAAEQLEDYLKEFPKSEKFGDTALADLSMARYNLEDYPAAIAASDQLEEFKPDSIQMARVLNIEGDAYIVSTDDLKGKEHEAQRNEYKQKALEAYLSAADVAKKLMSENPDQEEYFKNVAAEAIWKACDQYISNEQQEEALAQYDKFFPDYEGTYWEAQISVFALESLEAAGRAEEGLKQVEKMINVIGNKPPEEQDMELLRQAIGSYSEASVRVHGAEETIETLDNFPGLDPDNQALLTWLKIQKVIVLQELRKTLEKDSSEYAAIEGRINAVFEELGRFEIENLSEYALQQIGLNFSRGPNPFNAVRYFNELLSRENPEAVQFKAPADFEIGKIEMRSPDASKVQTAIGRFRRIIQSYKDRGLTPGSHLNLAKIYIDKKNWDDALAELQVINKEKWMFKEDRASRAEAGLMLGQVLEEKKDVLGAAKAYLAVLSAYNAFPEYATEAFFRYAKISLKDITEMAAGDPDAQAKKREREMALYKIYLKHIYMWQKLKTEDSPTGALTSLRRELGVYKNELGIGTEDEQTIRFSLGIEPDWNPEAPTG